MKREALRVLLLDPDEGAVQRIDLLLRRAQLYTFTLDVAADIEVARSLLHKYDYDVYLIAHETLIPEPVKPITEQEIEAILDDDNPPLPPAQAFWRRIMETTDAGLVLMVTNERKVYRTTIYGMSQSMLNTSIDSVAHAVRACEVLTRWNFDSVVLERVLGLAARLGRQQQQLHELRTENAALTRSQEKLQAMLDGQAILSAIDRKLGYSIDVDRVLDQALQTLNDRTGAAACTIGWIEDETRQLQVMASYGRSKMLAVSTRLDRLLTSGSPLATFFMPDGDVMPVVNEDSEWIALPLTIGEVTHGVILLEDIPANRFNLLDLDFLRQLAERMGAALENARVHRRARMYGVYMERLYATGITITSSMEVETMLEMATQGMKTLLDSSSAFCCIYEPRQRVMTVRSISVRADMPESLPPIQATFNVDDYPRLMETLYEGPVPVRLSSRRITEGERDLLQTLNVQSVLAVPLPGEADLVGMIVACESRYERFWQNDEIAVARSLGNQIAMSWKQVRLLNDVQELEKTKTRMIRVASHDLKNPLQQIIGYLDLIKLDVMPNLPEQQQQYILNIYKAARKIEHLTEDILNLERAGSESSEEWETIHIQPLLKSVYDGMTAQASLHDQTFKLNMSEIPAYIHGSQFLIQQVFSNLLDNALKYTPEGGDIVVNLDVDSQRMAFQVKDNGYGIPIDRQQRIFETFYRASTPRTRHIPGTGLGLSAVRTTIQRHGGDVWFESEEGKGSTFGFWLPLSNTPEVVT